MRFLTTHDKFSFVKSGLRIVGCLCLWWSTSMFIVFMVAAEVLGIMEEL